MSYCRDCMNICFLIVCSSMLSLSGCMGGHQYVNAEQELPSPYFEIRDSIDLTSVSVTKPNGAGIPDDMMWNSFAMDGVIAIKTDRLTYGVSPQGFHESVSAKPLLRGVVYKVGFGGLYNQLASGHFFYVLDQRDNLPLNVHYISAFDDLTDCIKTNSMRFDLLEKCKSNEWVIEGQEHWDDRIDFLLKTK